MTLSLKTIALIPARLESSRLPEKALADICGMPMVVHVYKRCQLAKSLDSVYIATDSDKIRQTAEKFGCRVIMTSSRHQNGTERIAEAARELDCAIVVNVQGDEALVLPEHIDSVVDCLKNSPEYSAAILVNPFDKRGSASDIKAVLNKKNEVMYFSRADIPSDARTENPPMLKAYHVIPFRKEFLLRYIQMERGGLEKAEYNEYLRILENGEKMKAVWVESSALSVDMPEDLEYVRQKMRDDPVFSRYKSV